MLEHKQKRKKKNKRTKNKSGGGAAAIMIHISTGRQMPIIASEWGYSSCFSNVTGAPCLCTPSSSTGLTSLDDQAKFVARQRLVSALLGVAVTIWYDFSNDCQDCYGKPRPCACSPMYRTHRRRAHA